MNIKLTPEKQNELWHDYGKVLYKLRAACAKTKSASCQTSWTNKRAQRVLVLDIVGVMNEAKLRVWSAWVAALLKDEHFISKKGYVYSDGVLRYYIAPNWKYYGLDTTRKDWILPDPKDSTSTDDFDIDKQMKILTGTV